MILSIYFKRLILLLLISSTNISFGTDRGKLSTVQTPEELNFFTKNDKIQLTVLRKYLTNILTNNDVHTITIFEDVKINLPKRKKAFIRHIKHISEKLEEHYFLNKKVDETVIELIWELILFRESLILEGRSANQTVSKKEQLQLARDYRKSKKIFQFIIPEKIELEDQPSSPYWHKINDTIKPHEQFDVLAKEKKIKARKKMIVIFDGLSYSGSAPKIKAKDLDYDNEWSLKWGDEIHTDILGSRIFAALGYDVDHPYHYGKDDVTLIFDETQTIKNHTEMIDSLTFIFGVDISPFVSSYGIVTDSLIDIQKNLKPYKNLNYVRFIECGLEARPDRVKRLGSFLPQRFNNHLRRGLRGSLLAHAFIDNWDTREMNTLLTTVHDGNYQYRISAVFSDLGTSLGVHVNNLPPDFKVGLVNELDWEVAIRKDDKLILNYQMNALLLPYTEAQYEDLLWMAGKIISIDSLSLRKMIEPAGWPKPVEELYFHKMASRRASIVTAFELTDSHPIIFNKNLTIEQNGKFIVKNGVLTHDFNQSKHPENFISKKGRKRNYGY